MKNYDNSKNCPIGDASRLIGDFWNILIIRELLKGTLRFNELKEIVEGITNSTLSDRLKNLVDSGIIERKQYQCIPPKVEYSLSKKGYELKNLIEELEKFGKNLS